MSDAVLPGELPRPAPAAVIARKWLWLSLIVNLLLLIATGGVGLFAFLLSYDLQEARLQLEKEIQTRQRTERYLQESRMRLAEVQREAERLSQVLSARATDPARHDAGKPELPVTLHFRKAFWGKGLVAEIDNTSEQYLTLILSVRNPTLATARRFQITIKGGDDLAFGHDDGWQFASGDEVGIYHNDYKPLKAIVP
jgi:hypothetical protein